MSRMRRVKRIILGSFACMLILISLLAYCLQPVAKFSDKNVSKASLKDMIGKEMLSSITSMLIERTQDFNFTFSEKNINDMLAWSLSNSKQDNMKYVKGIHCSIEGRSAILYVDVKLSSFLSTQFILKSNISIEDDKLVLGVEEAHIGRISLPPSWILKAIEGRDTKINVNNANSTISISMDLPKQMVIKDFKVSNSISFKLSISVKSKWDLVSLLMYIFEKDFERIIKNITLGIYPLFS